MSTETPNLSTGAEPFGNNWTFFFQLPELPGVHVISTWFLSIVGALGVVLNILAIAVLLQKAHRSSTSSFYLLNLAFGDFVTCTGVPLRILDYEERIDWSPAGCYGYTTVRFLPIFVSINTMILVAIERHFAIIRPSQFKAFTSKRTVLRQIIGVWLVSLLELSYLLTRAKAVFVITRNYCVIYDNIRTVSYNFLTVVGIPAVLLVIIYGQIFFTFWSKPTGIAGTVHPLPVLNASSTGTHIVNDAARRRRKRAIKTAQVLMLIAILFLLCWLPTLALWYVYMNNGPSTFFFSSTWALFQACSVMIFAHSCVNPIIYFTTNAAYRKSLKRLLTCGLQCTVSRIQEDTSENKSRTHSTGAGLRLGNVVTSHHLSASN